jgi:hypothetical protein
VNVNNTIRISLGGGDPIDLDVHYLNSYSPLVGDAIWVLVNGADILALGNNLPSSWAGFTPTYATVEGTGSPALGNGTFEGAYQRNGNNLTVRYTLTVGSTTNLGVGRVLFFLPATLQFAGSINAYQSVSAFVVDANTGAVYDGIGRGRGGQTGVGHSRGFLIATGGQEVSGSSPWPMVFASGDVISLSGSVEIV